MHVLCSRFLAPCFQGYQDVRDRVMHRSTSQGSINSPVYSRHSYTPTTSRSPQHFHRPGKGGRSRDSFQDNLCFDVIFFPPSLMAGCQIHTHPSPRKKGKKKKTHIQLSFVLYLFLETSHAMVIFISMCELITFL